MSPVRLAARVDGLDCELFSAVESQTTEWDRRSLLALHSAVAAKRPAFSYLEIGSYLGGSLQVLMRDPRCAHVMSIDTRAGQAADKRGVWTYEGNTTTRMRELLATVPGAYLGKLSTFEIGTDKLRIDDLPARPDYCFIDGEHTDEAALRDARFCARALPDSGGVVAFHDYSLVEPAIRAFLREAWRDVSRAVAFAGLMFALELGDTGILRSTSVDRAIASRWHSVAWRLAGRSRRSPLPLLALWSAMPVLDTAIFRVKRTVGRVPTRAHEPA